MLNSIFYKSLSALYNLNQGKSSGSKSIIVDAIYKGLIKAKDGLNEANLEMALNTATGEWLDFWGNFYGVYRIAGEKDNPYRERIIEEIIAPKATIPALKRATSRYLKTYQGEILDATDVKIFEPWTHLIKFDERGTLDGAGRLVSYNYWNYAVLDISLPNASLLTTSLIEYLNKIKAAGVKIIFSIAPNWGVVKDKDWEENRYKLWEKIHREIFILPTKENNAFNLLSPGWKPHIVDSNSGGILDRTKYLDGRQFVLWDGILRTRTIYATGALRDFRNSSVLSLKSYEKLENKELTLGEAITMEQNALQGTRTEEGKLTHAQHQICLKTDLNSTEKGRYIPYTKVGSEQENYLFPYGNIMDFVSFNEIGEFTNISDAPIGEIEEVLYAPKNTEGTNLSNAIRKLRIKHINITNKNESKQLPLIIK